MLYNPNPSVDLPFGKDNKYFRQLFDAILQVEKKFVEYRVDFGEGREGYVPHLERVFAYELYRQWANRIEKDKEPLVLNAEIKKIVDGDHIICYVDNKEGQTEEQKATLYPDIVLHHSQSDDQSQILICEIKRAINSYNGQSSELTGSAIFGDIHKIWKYMTKLDGDKKPFTYGVFLVTNGSLSIITDKVKNDVKIKINQGIEELEFGHFLKEHNCAQLFKRIVCIAYDGVRVEYNTFDNLFRKTIISLVND